MQLMGTYSEKRKNTKIFELSEGHRIGTTHYIHHFLAKKQVK
jgi:hypothetical protein